MGGTKRPWRSRRLVLRIYLHSMVLLLLFGVAQALVFRYAVRPSWRGSRVGRARYFIEDLAAKRGDPAELARLRRDVDGRMTLFDPSGAPLESVGDKAFAPLGAAQLATLVREHDLGMGDAAIAHAVMAGDQLVAYGIYEPPRRSWPVEYLAWLLGIVLVLLAAAAFLLARSLAHPLERLAGVARALGEGALDVRAKLDRRDEFGDVGRAFDEMADRVQQLVRSQRELLANVSHELRTPVSRIRVAIDLGVEGDQAGARESLDLIAQDLAELERLLEDVFTAARLDLQSARPLDAGGPPLRLDDTPAAELLERAATRFRGLHSSHPLELRLAAPLPALRVDAMLLRRVLDNLLDNARKYSEAGSQIVLAGRTEDHRLLVEVSDRGAGIDPADLPHVFTPFFRADRSRSRATGGVGLGLALARQIVTAHGGTIRIASTRGEGTTVSLELPIA